MVITRKKRILLISLTSASIAAAATAASAVLVVNKNAKTHYESLITQNFNMASEYSVKLVEFENEIEASHPNETPIEKLSDWSKKVNETIVKVQEFIDSSHAMENEEKLKNIYSKLKAKLVILKARIVKVESEVNEFKKEFDEAYKELYSDFENFRRKLSRRDITAKELINSLEESKEFLDKLEEKYKISKMRKYRLEEMEQIYAATNKLKDDANDYDKNVTDFIVASSELIENINALYASLNANKELKVKSLESTIVSLEDKIKKLTSLYEENKVKEGPDFKKQIKTIAEFIKYKSADIDKLINR